jgi:hypothetical protein
VEHFQIGETVPYDGGAMRAAMDRLRDAAVQHNRRSNAARIASAFSDRGVVEWLEKSIELGRAADSRFEDAFQNYVVDGE